MIQKCRTRANLEGYAYRVCLFAFLLFSNRLAGLINQPRRVVKIMKAKKRGSGFQEMKFPKVMRRGCEEVEGIPTSSAQARADSNQNWSRSTAESTVMDQAIQAPSTVVWRTIGPIAGRCLHTASASMSASMSAVTPTGCLPQNLGLMIAIVHLAKLYLQVTQLTSSMKLPVSRDLNTVAVWTTYAKRRQ